MLHPVKLASILPSHLHLLSLSNVRPEIIFINYIYEKYILFAVSVDDVVNCTVVNMDGTVGILHGNIRQTYSEKSQCDYTKYKHAWNATHPIK